MWIWEEGQPDGKTRLHSASLAAVLSLQPSNASLLASHHCPARLQAKDLPKELRRGLPQGLPVGLPLFPNLRQVVCEFRF